MFKHYLTTALRHFRRHKLTATINVVCLTIGLVCFLTIYAVVTYLNSGDRHFANADRIHLISIKANAAPTNLVGPWLTANYIKTDFPEVETVARVTVDIGLFNEVPISIADRKTFVTVAYADPEFLQVFDLPFVAGESTAALREPFSAVLSAETASRLFGSVGKAIGQKLRLQNGRDVTVRGVLGELKQPSHISTGGEASLASVHFDALLSMDVFEQNAAIDSARASILSNWSTPFFLTYVLLPKDGSLTVAALKSRLQSFGERHANTAGNVYQFDTVPISHYRLSLFNGFAGSEKTGISITMIFYFLGAIVLLTSCLNYTNLATAQASTRAKEIGMRRVMGASRSQIIVQFLFEAALLSLVALLCALTLVAVGVGVLQVSGSAAAFGSLITSGEFWLTLLSLLVIVTAVAGLYPAFVLSGARPIQAMRAGKVRSGGRLMPRLLVGVQFSVASFLLVSMLVMMAQNAQLKRSVLSGAATEMVVMSNDIRAATVDYETLRSELLRQEHIQAVTAAQISPWALPAMPAVVASSQGAMASKIATTQSIVNYDFFATMDINVLAGRGFDRSYASDAVLLRANLPETNTGGVVIDRALAEQNGWLQPTEAVGKLLYVTEYGNAGKSAVPLAVIGVVENRAIGIVSPIGATSNMYVLTPSLTSFPIIKISTANGAAALKEIEAVWNKLAPTVALKMKFADDILDANYKIIESVAKVFTAVATLALTISVLGLIGMSIQIIGRRQHEIGIRKTLGASVRSIVRLLITDFSKPVVIANVLTWPLAFIAMKLYLNMFTQRTGLSAAPFAVSLLLTVLVAWIAVAAQATRAARMNPATVLRYE